MSNSDRGYIDCNRIGHIRDVDGNPLTSEQTQEPTKNHVSTNSNKKWIILFYVPNLMGYIRIILSFWGYRSAMLTQNNKALNMWIAASILDLFDGMAARRLDQCSQFGVLLDIIADNILRSIVWMSNIMGAGAEVNDSSGTKRCLWTAIIFLEWITMFSSQCKASRIRGHWKEVNQKEPPRWVQAVFENNFRTIPGILAIYGLFVAPMGTFVMQSDEVWPRTLLSENAVFTLVVISYVGRILSAFVELWICFDFMMDVVHNDDADRIAKRTT